MRNTNVCTLYSVQGARDKSRRFVPKTEKYITYLFWDGFNSKSYMFF